MADGLNAAPAELRVLADEEEVAREAAALTAALLAQAIDRRGAGHVALTGGSSAVPLYRALEDPSRRGAVDWARVHLWWADERFVPADHPESNAGLVYRVLLSAASPAGETGAGAQFAGATSLDRPGVPIDPQNVHPVQVDEALGDSEPVELAAQRYADDLARWLPHARGAMPRFDLILTGLGADGHIMSVFPGSPALAADAPAVMAVPAPDHVEPHLPRVTLTTRLLPLAERVLVMASGSAKRDILSQVLGTERDARRLPAQAALLPNAVWLVDRAAAGAFSF